MQGGSSDANIVRYEDGLQIYWSWLLMTDRSSAARGIHGFEKRETQTQTGGAGGGAGAGGAAARASAATASANCEDFRGQSKAYEICAHTRAWSTRQLEHMHHDNGRKKTGSLIITLESDTRVTR